MSIVNKNYEYDGAWFGKEKVSFNGRVYEVDVQIDSDDEDMIPENAKEVLTDLLNNMENYTSQVAESILDYYNDRRDELGYSDVENPDYPEIDTAEEILDMVSLIGITVPDQDDYDDTAFSLVFDCTWDKENGVGVCFEGGEVEDVGFQGIAL